MKRLQEIAAIIRKENTDFLELTRVMKNYESLLLELTDIAMEDDDNREDIHFKNGKAIGTTWAAFCIKDILRTKTFIKALFAAIEYVRETNKNPVHVLYAGSGPFATLILPIMSVFSEKEVQFTILEVNKTSLDIAKEIISRLGFNAHVKEFINEDATQYIVDPDCSIDILVSETMQRALANEQQVGIAMNIMSQLNDRVILIPEKIRLDLCLMDVGKFLSRDGHTDESDYCIRLGKILELSKEEIKSFDSISRINDESFYFWDKDFNIPFERLKAHSQLAIITEMQVFKEDRIRLNESSLTTPYILEDFSDQQKGISVKTRYKIDEEPGIVYLLS